MLTKDEILEVIISEDNGVYEATKLAGICCVGLLVAFMNGDMAVVTNWYGLAKKEIVVAFRERAISFCPFCGTKLELKGVTP